MAEELGTDSDSALESGHPPRLIRTRTSGNTPAAKQTVWGDDQTERIGPSTNIQMIAATRTSSRPLRPLELLYPSPGAAAALELSMLRFPPNLNIELFQWRTADQRTEHPRHSDRGGHHLCLIVDDVDQAVAHLETIPGVRVLGGRKEVGPDSPLVAGNRWTYFLTPWGLLMELVDRSRVKNPPNLVGPAEWDSRAIRSTSRS